MPSPAESCPHTLADLQKNSLLLLFRLLIFFVFHIFFVVPPCFLYLTLPCLNLLLLLLLNLRIRMFFFHLSCFSFFFFCGFWIVIFRFDFILTVVRVM